MALTLVIGNKNYSSWSMRPWMMLKAAGIPFEEVVIPLYTGDADKQRILKYSPAGKVPILVDGAISVWDSLAIIEYLAERYPDKAIWPAEPAARALARSISAEMHSGFMPLRNECSMNIHRKPVKKQLSADAVANVARISEIWAQCRGSQDLGSQDLGSQDLGGHASAGPFLFGRFSGADAMYAPVIQRFVTYGVELTGPAADYMQTMRAFAPFREWTEAALRETWMIERFEQE